MNNFKTLPNATAAGLVVMALSLVSPAFAQQLGFDSQQPNFTQPLGSDLDENSDLLEVNHASDEQLNAYDAWFAENEDRHLQHVADLVAFPTLAMVPEKSKELVKAGEFLAGVMTDIGLENAVVHPAGGFPMVTAEWIGAEGQPTVLFYGHYDVQPADASRWDSDPYVAEIREGRMYGRGATDDKGPIIALLSAMEAQFTLDGSLPVNVKLLLDGAEEFGSQSMVKWLSENSEWIGETDYGFNADAMMYSDDQGLMWKGLRGGSDVEITLTSANTALHSGIYGGAAPNAAVAAAKIIASMWDDNGMVSIEGFEDDVLPASDVQRSEIADAVAGVSEADARARLDISQWVGDDNFTIVERTWIRPSLDVTGIKGGYIEGKASTIPFSAWFRVMARTAPGQDPVKVNKAIMAHIEQHVPWGVKLEMTGATFGSAPFFAEDDLNFRLGKTVLTEVFGKEPRVLYVGGGVPALAYVPEAGGPNLVTFGFQRSDEGFHADNEFMRIDSFRIGQRAYAKLLHAMVGQPLRE